MIRMVMLILMRSRSRLAKVLVPHSVRSHGQPFPRRRRRSYIQVKAQSRPLLACCTELIRDTCFAASRRCCRCRCLCSPSVKIDNIPHLLSRRPFDGPIVSIKRRLVPRQSIHPRSPRHISWSPLERDQLGLLLALLLTRPHSLPRQDLLPRLLVDRVVDRDHYIHIRHLRILVLALHGVVELLG